MTAAGIYVAVGTIPVLLGVVGRSMLPELQNGDQVLPALARHYMGELGFVIFAGALVAAILSTVDSALLACGSLVAHNLLPSGLRARSPRAPLIAARASVLGLAFVAYGIAPHDHAVVEQALVSLTSAVRRAACPYCGSSNTERKSEFGSTACKAIHYCHHCRQPFEEFKAI